MVGFQDYWEYVLANGTHKNIASFFVALPFLALSDLYKFFSFFNLNSNAPEVADTKITIFQEQTREVSENYIRNIRYMEGLCKGQNVVFISVLQPVNGLGKRALTTEDRMLISGAPDSKTFELTPAFNFTSECFSNIIRECSRESWFVDFTHVFDNEANQIFFDNVHFSDRGNRIVAEALRDVLVMKGLK